MSTSTLGFKGLTSKQDQMVISLKILSFSHVAYWAAEFQISEYKVGFPWDWSVAGVFKLQPNRMFAVYNDRHCLPIGRRAGFGILSYKKIAYWLIAKFSK